MLEPEIGVVVAVAGASVFELREARRPGRRRHGSCEQLREGLAVFAVGQEAGDERHGPWAEAEAETRPTIGAAGVEERLERGARREGDRRARRRRSSS